MKKKKILAIEKFGEKKVLVIGDVMLDIYDFCYTEFSRAIDSEKPGKRAFQAQKSIKVLGGAGNVAANLAALGVKTSMISVTGKDGHYFTLANIADKSGIKHFLVQDASRPTTTKIRLYIDNEYILRKDDEKTDRIDRSISASIMSEVIKELETVDAVIFSDYNKGLFTEENTREIIKKATEKLIPIIVDFKPENKDLFTGVDVIAPNASEAKAIMAEFSIENLEASITTLYDKLLCKKLIVTLGKDGICGFDGESFFHLAAHNVQEVDGVGCGDTVRMGLAMGIVSGLSLEESASLANDAAGVIVQKIGTASLERHELINFIKSSWQESV